MTVKVMGYVTNAGRERILTVLVTPPALMVLTSIAAGLEPTTRSRIALVTSKLLNGAEDVPAVLLTIKVPSLTLRILSPPLVPATMALAQTVPPLVMLRVP